MRVEYDDGFGLVRASNTTPVLVLRFEGTTPEALARIETDCLAALRAVKPDAQIGDGGALTQRRRALRTPRGMRVLIVKLSSLGDVVHTLPVVADIRAAHPDAVIDWVVEPAFAPLVARVDGIAEVIECALRRWTRQGWWRAATRAEFGRFRARLRRHRYDAVIDLQGLTKSALIASLAPRPELRPGQSHRRRQPRVAGALAGAPRRSGSSRTATRSTARASWSPRRWRRATTSRRRSVWRQRRRAEARAPSSSIHGTSRADKLWPEASWIELGKRLVAAGWAIALPQSSAEEKERAERIAAAVGIASEVWPRARHRRADRSPGRVRRRDRRRQRAEPHRRRPRPAARPDLQLSDRLAHRAAGAARRAPSAVDRRPADARRRRRLDGVADGAATRRGDRAMSGSPRRAVARSAYSTLLRLVVPLYALRIFWRGRREPLYASAIGERFGLYRRPAPKGAIWIHAVSLGETRAAAALIDALRAAITDVRILLTHGTATGRAAGERAAARGRRASLAAVRHARRRCVASCATSRRVPAS